MTDERLDRIRRTRDDAHGPVPDYWRSAYRDDVGYLLGLLYVDDPTLFDADPAPLDIQGPAHRTDDHTTSITAALSHLGARANQRTRLATQFFYEALRGGGLTDEEAARRANILKGSPWKRCTDLRAGHWLEWTGETRPTETGDQAKVWKMTSWGVVAFRRHLDERAVS